MSKKKQVQIAAIFFLLIAVILLFPITDWNKTNSIYGFISLLCGTTGSIISLFIPTSYTLNFTNNDWQQDNGGGFEILISSKKHGLGSYPHVQTFIEENNTFQEIGVSSEHDKKGNVTIGANSTFCGRIIITA
jgi:hypothetical protein